MLQNHPELKDRKLNVCLKCGYTAVTGVFEPHFPKDHDYQAYVDYTSHDWANHDWETHLFEASNVDLSKLRLMLDKPIKCDQCDKRFALWYSYIYHRRLYHEGKKHNKSGYLDPPPKFRVVCELCGRSVLNTEYERHQKNVHNSKNLPEMQCKLCKYKTTDPRNFKTHFWNRHHKDNKRKFQCHKCGQDRRKKDALKKHLATQVINWDLPLNGYLKRSRFFTVF